MLNWNEYNEEEATTTDTNNDVQLNDNVSTIEKAVAVESEMVAKAKH